jgi:hypothetical protein
VGMFAPMTAAPGIAAAAPVEQMAATGRPAGMGVPAVAPGGYPGAGLTSYIKPADGFTSPQLTSGRPGSLAPGCSTPPRFGPAVHHPDHRQPAAGLHRAPAAVTGPAPTRGPGRRHRASTTPPATFTAAHPSPPGAAVDATGTRRSRTVGHIRTIRPRPGFRPRHRCLGDWHSDAGLWAQPTTAGSPGTFPDSAGSDNNHHFPDAQHYYSTDA